MRILLLTTALLVVLVTGHQRGQRTVAPNRDDPDQFIVAILRADGTLVPFAQYGNGGWTNPWPGPREAATSVYAEDTGPVIPHSLGNLPEPWFKQCGRIPAQWYFWSSRGAAKLLKASEVVQVENHSQTNWALLTDFPRQNTNDTHHRNLGVALNANLEVEPWAQIQADNAEAEDVLSFVRQVFEDAPRAKLTNLYRSNSRFNGEYLYYVEAEKQHNRSTLSSERGCNDISLFQGWISADAKGGMGLLDSRVSLTDCDMKGPSFSTPLGIMKLKNRTFLFVSEHGWENESYLILELDETTGLRKVSETYGG
jgi:hypothetical protein